MSPALVGAVTCALRTCSEAVTQAFDVGSWHAKPTVRNTRHYEVCDEHAAYFTGFDRRASERVEREMVPYVAGERRDEEAHG